MFLSPGDRLDRYEIVMPLAVGGMAELYLARATAEDEGFEKLCVIKRILAQHASDEAFVRMFLDEARLAATLNHPNVIQVYDVGRSRGRHYFAMEYVHGQDLTSIVAAAREARRGLRVGNALAIASAAAAGLHHAHEQRGADGEPLGIVHRDVSPGNILVSYEGHVKVVDFGIAKAAAAARATKTTSAGLKGKLCYMSPEQVTASPDLDRRSDIFSLGVVLYELTTGKPLFRGDSDFIIAEQILDGAYARPSVARPGYDARLEDIVMTALAPEPAQRFATAQELQLALDDYARAADLVATPHALGDFMRELFGKRVEAWELARRAGRSLADHVRATASHAAIRVTEADLEASSVDGADPVASDAAAASMALTAIRDTPPRARPSRKPIVIAAVGAAGLAAFAYAATRDGSKQATTATTVASAAPAPSEPRRYTIEDLEALVGQRGHREAVEHLGDIAPAQRDARWLGAAAASTVGLLAETPPELRLELQESFERTWPMLLKAPPYAAARDDLALPAFDHCFANPTDACGKLVASYVERGASPATVIALGKLAQRRGLLPLALPLFRRAALADAQACGDPDFATVALENITSEDGAALASACWSATRDRVRAYVADPRAYGRASVCRLLAERGEPCAASAAPPVAPPRRPPLPASAAPPVAPPRRPPPTTGSARPPSLDDTINPYVGSAK